ncbi:hypothetical protein KNE206_00570 [Kitasatospora sp. NE20-6]|uniref:glycosyltransferase family 2 protein n=1 Tax=Kitasatospora sp. NE20-6 TaxID=2859066 RepID=UPI0034DBE81E
MFTVDCRPAGTAQVVELDLDHPDVLHTPGHERRAAPDGHVLALVRQHGHPLGLVEATGTAGDPVGLRRALVEAAYQKLCVPGLADARPRPHGHRPAASVVIATRNRPGPLRHCLESLFRQEHRPAEVIVVDNAPSDDATERLVRDTYPGRVRYLHEPVAGLARARNTGLAAARGEICAFADDDLVLDPGWLGALADAFATDRRVGCVTGPVLPVELATDAQAAVEQYGGGYAKGFTARHWSLEDGPDDPLLPFKVCTFGTGANMAFHTRSFRRLGGFDQATGAGTPTRGGEDMMAFFRVLVDGRTVAYQPDAIVWHRHHRTMEALTTQVFNYGVGFGAFLAAAVRTEPRLLGVLLRGLPRASRQWWAGRVRDQAALTVPGTPRHLNRRELAGLLYGPLTYVVSVRRQDRPAEGGHR